MADMVFEFADRQSTGLDGPAVQPSSRVRQFNERTRTIIWLTLAFWFSNFAMLTVGNVIEDSERWLELAAVRAALIGLGLLFCYGMHLALEKVAGRSFRRRLIAAAVLAPILAETYAWANYFAFAALDPSRLGKPFDWNQVMITLAFWTWFFLAWAGLYLAAQYYFDVREEEQRSSELGALAHAAKLRALHNQVNPHFLFNSLNSISALIADNRAAEADAMVAKLGHFFRMTLAIDPMDDISLAQEISLQQAYLEIEQLRYPDLKVDIDLPERAAKAAVPALILQPIVENAVKYGVAGSPPPSSISIRAAARGDRLTLQVTDSGRQTVPVSAPGAGVGLKNVRDRLFQRFGASQRFSAVPEPSGEFRVSIDIPLELVK